MGDLTPHFSWREFDCKDGTPVPAELRPHVEGLAGYLEIVRDAAGGRPVTIVSGYRTPAYNKRCGGAKASEHVKARAADIRIAGMTWAQVHALILRLIAERRIPDGGVGKYPPRAAVRDAAGKVVRAARPKGFVHYDIRGFGARWQG